MKPNLESVLDKLETADLDLLQDMFGINLRDPDVRQLAESSDEIRRRIVAVEESALQKIRKKNGHDPHCSYCNGPSAEVGKLCESQRGPYICRSCAETVVRLLNA